MEKKNDTRNFDGYHCGYSRGHVWFINERSKNMKEKLLAQLLFFLIKNMPYELVGELILKYCGQLGEWVETKVLGTENKWDDRAIEFFRSVFRFIGVDHLKQIADAVLDYFEDQGQYSKICLAIRRIFGVPDNDVPVEEIANLGVAELPDEKFRKIFHVQDDVSASFKPYKPENNK